MSSEQEGSVGCGGRHHHPAKPPAWGGREEGGSAVAVVRYCLIFDFECFLTASKSSLSIKTKDLQCFSFKLIFPTCF